jgi:hypothetical protein
MNAAAIAAARARRRVRHAFEENDAFSAERAIGFEPQRRLERRWLERLIAGGGIVEARPGAYYMDRETYAEIERRWRLRALAMVGTALAASLAMFGISQL